MMIDNQCHPYTLSNCFCFVMVSSIIVVLDSYIKTCKLNVLGWHFRCQVWWCM